MTVDLQYHIRSRRTAEQRRRLCDFRGDPRLLRAHPPSRGLAPPPTAPRRCAPHPTAASKLPPCTSHPVPWVTPSPVPPSGGHQNVLRASEFVGFVRPFILFFGGHVSGRARGIRLRLTYPAQPGGPGAGRLVADGRLILSDGRDDPPPRRCPRFPIIFPFSVALIAVSSFPLSCSLWV